MSLTIFEEYAPVLASLNDAEIDDPQSVQRLKMADERIGTRQVEMIYAPFDHINTSARVVIVGMTPGRFQASNALRSARRALLEGQTVSEAAAAAKSFASFSGEPMRTNLIRMLDSIGVGRWLGLTSTASLWSERNDLVHFNSALRYPVFVDGQNWSGTPDMVKTPALRQWLEAYTGQELRLLSEALIVPLGPKVAEAMKHLAAKGVVDEGRILEGLPHPSGANAERIAFFLGDKAAEHCSAKTNPEALSAAKSRLEQRIAALSPATINSVHDQVSRVHG